MTFQAASRKRDEPENADGLVLAELLRFNATVSGIVTGMVAALVIFVATNWLVLKGGAVVGPHLSLLGQFFIGYRVSVAGSLIGAAYGFACGSLVGYFVTSMYNRLVDLRDGKRVVGRNR